MKVLDLFSGIGGFSLGLERTGGFGTVAFCEIDHYCRKVLAKHWPEVPCYDDIRTLTADRLAADGIGVDVICGGFPCQDISVAGKGLGLAGERSGLWREFHRLIGELRPRYVIVENTAALLHRGLGRVLGDLASIGYDTEWHCIPAAYVGADHIRDRVWIIAYPDEANQIIQRRTNEQSEEVGENVADPDSLRELQQNRGEPNVRGWIGDRSEADFPRGYREIKPVLGRGVHGIPGRLDRIGALGNAVVPQIPELLGRSILAAKERENERRVVGPLLKVVGR